MSSDYQQVVSDLHGVDEAEAGRLHYAESSIATQDSKGVGVDILCGCRIIVGRRQGTATNP